MMRIVMRTALVSLALLAALPLFASESYVSSLPIGRVKVNVMTAVTASHATESAQAARGNRSNAEPMIAAEERIASEHARAHEPKQDATFVAPRHDDVMLVKTGDAIVEFVRANDGRIVLQSNLPELNGVAINLNEDAVETPFGKTTERADVKPADYSAEGAWSGVQYTLDTEGEELSSSTKVKLAIGRLEHDGRMVLLYEAKHIAANEMPKLANVMIVVP